ncbi:hypothetical protein KLEP181_gp51 [Paracoccus phage vB_PmaP_KLEP18-1]|nr:hypothetical protein KLEP181_gp51 [Paracoccus phage vB_PmaP_KLEP18-1]
MSRAPLTPPARFIGPTTKWTDPDLRAERRAWMVARGREGYSSAQVGAALEISQTSAHRLMVLGGWDAWAAIRERKPAPPKATRHRRVVLDGVAFPSLRALADAVGRPYNTVKGACYEARKEGRTYVKRKFGTIRWDEK